MQTTKSADPAAEDGNHDKVNCSSFGQALYNQTAQSKGGDKRSNDNLQTCSRMVNTLEQNQYDAVGAYSTQSVGVAHESKECYNPVTCSSQAKSQEIVTIDMLKASPNNENCTDPRYVEEEAKHESPNNNTDSFPTNPRGAVSNDLTEGGGFTFGKASTDHVVSAAAAQGREAAARNVRSFVTFRHLL